MLDIADTACIRDNRKKDEGAQEILYGETVFAFIFVENQLVMALANRLRFQLRRVRVVMSAIAQRATAEACRA